jgi:hypothetical protein
VSFHTVAKTPESPASLGFFVPAPPFATFRFAPDAVRRPKKSHLAVAFLSAVNDQFRADFLPSL